MILHVGVAAAICCKSGEDMIKVYEIAEVGLGLDDVVAAVALVFILVIVNNVAHFVSDVG